MLSPIPVLGGNALIRDISCESTARCSGSRPPPVYSFGQAGAVQPRAAIA